VDYNSKTQHEVSGATVAEEKSSALQAVLDFWNSFLRAYVGHDFNYYIMEFIFSSFLNQIYYAAKKKNIC
jgi:hypothetical protein